jgi:hypothetical protein
VFKRNKFFPNISCNNNNNVLISLSLGIINKISKSDIRKCNKKQKQNFIKTVEFLKNVFLSFKELTLNIFVKGVPKYLNDILRQLTSSTTKVISNPFSSEYLKPSLLELKNLKFDRLTYVNSYSYSELKKIKRGRVKRKVLKKIAKTNNLLD